MHPETKRELDKVLRMLEKKGEPYTCLLYTSALVTFLCMVFYHLGLGHNVSSMIIGSVIPMIPGVAFTNAIRDLTDGDYIAGSVRMMRCV